MAHTVETPAGEKDKVEIEQQKEKVVVLSADWKVTMWKVLKVGFYAFITTVTPVLIQMITDSKHPAILVWGPVIAMALRTVEGITRFHWGAVGK